MLLKEMEINLIPQKSQWLYWAVQLEKRIEIKWTIKIKINLFRDEKHIKIGILNDSLTNFENKFIFKIIKSQKHFLHDNEILEY
jgi:hypothetical protein